MRLFASVRPVVLTRVAVLSSGLSVTLEFAVGGQSRLFVWRPYDPQHGSWLVARIVQPALAGWCPMSVVKTLLSSSSMDAALRLLPLFNRWASADRVGPGSEDGSVADFVTEVDRVGAFLGGSNCVCVFLRGRKNIKLCMSCERGSGLRRTCEVTTWEDVCSVSCPGGYGGFDRCDGLCQNEGQHAQLCVERNAYSV